MGCNRIDDQLWECQKLMYGKEGRERMFYDWAVQALHWYINTGRASADWIAAFLRADAAELMRTASKHANSTAECVDYVTRYLRRRCKLAA